MTNSSNGLGADLPDTETQLFELEQYPLFNTDEILSTVLLGVPDNKQLLHTILLILKDELPKNISLLQKAFEVNEWESIEKLAHKMKGSALNCGTIKMRYACQYLERYRKAGHTKLLEPLYQQLLQVLEETKIALNEQLERH